MGENFFLITLRFPSPALSPIGQRTPLRSLRMSTPLSQASPASPFLSSPVHPHYRKEPIIQRARGLETRQPSTALVPHESTGTLQRLFHRATETEAERLGFLKALEDTCLQKRDELQRYLQGYHAGQDRRFLDAEVHALQIEANTWKLLQLLQISEEKFGNIMEVQYEGAGLDMAAATEALLKGDPKTRRISVVVDWLQQIAKEGLRQSTYSNEKQPLERTNELLSSGSAPDDLVTQIDPDAEIRERAYLERTDSEYEEALLRDLWTLVRAGCLEEAQELCRKAGQHWRAASLGGGVLAADPEMKVTSELNQRE